MPKKMENQLSSLLFGTVCLMSERFDSFGNHRILRKKLPVLKKNVKPLVKNQIKNSSAKSISML